MLQTPLSLTTVNQKTLLGKTLIIFPPHLKHDVTLPCKTKKDQNEQISDAYNTVTAVHCRC